MKVTLAAALAALFFAALTPLASAEEVSIGENYAVVIPDGSTITSETVVDTGAYIGDLSYATVDFTFADGSGTAKDNFFNDADGGSITFTDPVTNLTVNWVDDGVPGSFYEVGVGGETGTLDSVSGEPCPNYPVCTGPFSGTLSVAGPATSIGWGGGTGDVVGISSMSYTVAPEPSTALLLGLGLVGLALIKSRSSLLGRYQTFTPTTSTSNLLNPSV